MTAQEEGRERPQHDVDSSSDGEDEMALGGMFPEEARPPTPPPTFASYTPSDSAAAASLGGPLTIRLVSTHPLWAHHLWNASKAFADYVLAHADDVVRGRNVLELGAGGALPGIVCAKAGASKVVVTDYPDDELMENIRWNVEHAGLDVWDEQSAPDAQVAVLPHLWGKPVTPLLAPLRPATAFDLVILSDLIFNHSQHAALLRSCEAAFVHPGTIGRALVFHSHHLPQFKARDLGFFRRAERRGWTVRKVYEEKWGVMFEEDTGDEADRGTVWGWEMRWERQVEETSDDEEV